MEFKIGDYVIPRDNNKDLFLLEDSKINIGGVVVNISNDDSKCFIDIINLLTGKLSKELNAEDYQKSILPDELKDYYELLMSASNFMTYKTKQVDFYGETVSVNPLMDFLRKTQCLCLNCELMTGIKETNCKLAQNIYEMCVENYMSMAITKCKSYETKNVYKKTLKYHEDNV